MANANKGEEWPSLAASHGQDAAGIALTNNFAHSGNHTDGDNDWEMLNTTTETSFEGDMVMIRSPPPPGLPQKRKSSSVPDLRLLDQEAYRNVTEGSAGDGQDEPSEASSSMVVVSDPPSVAAEASGVMLVNDPWASATSKGVSFKDAILSPSKHTEHASPNKNNRNQVPTSPRQRNKFKSRIVVKPIQRCAKSSPDLRSLDVIDDVDDVKEQDIVGHTDAQEFYARKAHGERGRSNGMKLRPDEQKRRDMIITKKNAQRNQK